MKRLPSVDPVEKIVQEALEQRRLVFTDERNPDNKNLDFYIPSMNLHIEVKQFHSPRIAEQMSRVPNIIAIQGIQAALAFKELLAR